MTRFLMDTGIASDYINRRRGVYEKAKQALLAGDRVGVAMPVLGELYAGIELSASRDKNLSRLRRALNTILIWPFDHSAAEEYGRIFADLRRKGRPIPQIDIRIAATARALGNCTVVTKDRDFKEIPGLDVVDWSV